MLKRYPLNRDGTFIEIFVTDNNLWWAFLALHFANKHHFGEKREDGSPEINHCTRVACDLIDRGILHYLPLEEVDMLLAVALMHDTIENSPDEKKEEIFKEIKKRFGDVIAEEVFRLTKRPEHKGNPERYYGELKGFIHCIVVKAVDKENVAGTIVEVARTINRLERQAHEIELLLPMMKEAREAHPEYAGLLISARNHLKSILIGLKAHIKVLKEKEELEKKCGRLESRLKKK